MVAEVLKVFGPSYATLSEGVTRESPNRIAARLAQLDVECGPAQKSTTLQALILAGGRGMRMRPLSDIYPKPLLYLPGGTLLDYLLTHLRHLPLDEVAIVLHPEEERIVRHL